MAKTAIGPKESFQLTPGTEGVRAGSKLFEFARVAPSSQVVTFYRGSGTDTTGAIYLNGIDYLEKVFASAVVGNTDTTTIASAGAVNFINGDTTLAIWKGDDNTAIFDFMLIGISFGN